MIRPQLKVEFVEDGQKTWRLCYRAFEPNLQRWIEIPREDFVALLSSGYFDRDRALLAQMAATIWAAPECEQIGDAADAVEVARAILVEVDR